MRPLNWLLLCAFAVLVGYGSTTSLTAQSFHSHPQAAPGSGYWSDPANWLEQFVPDNQLFWDNSKNWPTNYGPSYRDTLGKPSQMLACSQQFALCFHSGPDPYPCHLAPDGRSANCLCTVQTSTSYVLEPAILNYPVYLATVKKCGDDGLKCPKTDDAPVCQFLTNGELIPGADVISTFAPESRLEIIKALATPGTNFKTCDKAAYAGCMTAPCRNNGDGTANCKCPVFYGPFQLTGKDAECELGGDLVNSASYNPLLESKK
jgi:hypothetical protein